MKNFSFFLLAVLLGCQPQKINQYLKMPGYQLRHGLWIEKSSSDLGEIVDKGRYNKGEKIGKWKTTVGGKRFQIDKVRKDLTITRIFYPNGKLMETGQSRTNISINERVWYKFGDWKHYDEKGKLTYIKRYSDGNMVDSISFAK